MVAAYGSRRDDVCKISRVRESTFRPKRCLPSIYWTSALQDTRSREFALELIRDSRRSQCTRVCARAYGDDDA
jgi:hypothetical protein